MRYKGLNLDDLEFDLSRSPGFQTLISRKGPHRRHIAIKHNRKSYMGSLMAPIHLTWSHPERSKSRSFRH